MDKSIYSREYAALLRVLNGVRTKSGLTQIELAARLQMTQSAYSKLERGELRLDIIQLRVIAKECGISLTDFVAQLEREISQPTLKKKSSGSRRK